MGRHGGIGEEVSVRGGAVLRDGDEGCPDHVRTLGIGLQRVTALASTISHVFMSTSLLWLRNDLRTHDHEPLKRAAKADSLLPVYCFDPRHTRETRWGFPKMSAHRVRFLLESLRDLQQRLRDLGSDLVIRKGRPEEVLPTLAREHDAGRLFFHAEPMREERDVESALRIALPDRVRVTSLWGHTLVLPQDLPFEIASTPDTYTTFRKAVESRSEVQSEVASPDVLPPLPDGLSAGKLPESVEELGTTPIEPDPRRAALAMRGGETKALDRLNAYLWERDRLKTYKTTRNGMLGADYSSKFSPWLALGCLSPRRVYHEVKRYETERVANKSTYWLIFELLWRDFFRFYGAKHGDRLFHRGGPQQRNIDRPFHEDAFAAWAAGRTGFPLVDANMRELYRTGFMSNRGRQNTASFLTKTLQQDWRAGAAYFESLLVDYDVTSNWGNWAYVAGVGADARRGRFFNIELQAARYDESAAYVKHWLPELETLPPQLAREPYRMSAEQQADTGVRLGLEYPPPMIDLDAAHGRLRGKR